MKLKPTNKERKRARLALRIMLFLLALILSIAILIPAVMAISNKLATIIDSDIGTYVVGVIGIFILIWQLWLAFAPIDTIDKNKG